MLAQIAVSAIAHDTVADLPVRVIGETVGTFLLTLAHHCLAFAGGHIAAVALHKSRKGGKH